MSHGMTEFLRAIPKVEIHCHLLGTVRQATFHDLAIKAKAPLTREEIDAFYLRGEKPVGVLKALRALDAHLIRRPDDLYRLTREYLEDAAAHGVRYSEFFWNPTGTAKVSHIPYGQAQGAIVRAIRDAERDFSIVARLIPSIDREAALVAARWPRGFACPVCGSAAHGGFVREPPRKHGAEHHRTATKPPGRPSSCGAPTRCSPIWRLCSEA